MVGVCRNGRSGFGEVYQQFAGAQVGEGNFISRIAFLELDRKQSGKWRRQI